VDRVLFLSHAAENNAFVNAFGVVAKRFLVPTWTDERLKAGELLWTTIAEGLEQTFIVLFFLTEASLTAARAEHRGVFIELDAVRRWQSSPERRPGQRVVVIDCVGLNDDELRSIEKLRPWAGTLRLDGRAAYDAHAGGAPSAEDQLDILVRQVVGRALDSRVTVFPRPSVTRQRRFYEPSWAGSGGAATLRTEMGFSSWDGEDKPRVPLERTPGGDEIRLDVTSGGAAGDWWAAILGFGTATDERWITVDIGCMDRLVIEARADGAPNGVPIAIRLEDSLTASTSGSRHQSSSAAEPAPVLVEYFGVYHVDLPSLKWDQRAYPGNTAPVAKDDILQIALGPGEPRHPYDAHIRIKRIEFQIA
jgi:hypothetical protein